MFKRLIALFVTVSFILSYYQPVYGQDFSINQLPVPGTMVGESVPFTPLALKGLVINLQKPLEFQFIVDTGNGPQDTASVKDQANQLVKYFLAGLTIPEGDLWVNLSPYEKNRMVPEALGQTDLGRDLLAQDYILKQLTASLIYPEKDLGKEFWSKVYARTQARFGTTNVPVNTFNKVWILPDQAQVFEHGAAAYVTKATLKVMLDEDYLALQKHMIVRNGTDSIGANIVREIVIPEITKEVNTGKNFAPLRQIYQALILAKWYKETIQNGLLDAVYTNKNKVAGVNLNNLAVKEQIYERYLKAYKKGAFNFIKEDPTPGGQVVPRKYFSGGFTEMGMKVEPTGKQSNVKWDGAMAVVTEDLQVPELPKDAAMTAEETIERYKRYFEKRGMDIVDVDFFSPDTNSVLKALREGKVLRLDFHKMKDFPEKDPWGATPFSRFNLALVQFTTLAEQYIANVIGFTAMGTHFAVTAELVKNAFRHGSKLDYTYPVYIYVDTPKKIMEVYNSLNLVDESSEKWFKTKIDAMEALLGGAGMGLEIIEDERLSYRREDVIDDDGITIGVKAVIGHDAAMMVPGITRKMVGQIYE